jgi:hypothetical protein
MKKNELIKIIETVVRKEVKKQMNEIFIKEENSSLLSELVSKPLTEKEFKEPIRKKQVKPKKEVHYTSNGTLNKILNETAGGIPQRDDEYATMGGGVYDSSRIDDVLVRNYGVGESSSSEVVKQRKRDIGAVQTIKNARINVDDVPDHITDALTRDYSKLMKVIDKKKVDR